MRVSGQALYPRGNSPSTHFIGWMGPRANLDELVKMKVSSQCQQSNHNFCFLFRRLVSVSWKGIKNLCV